MLLLAKQDSSVLTGKNESNGWSLGGSLDLSGGWGLNASVNKGKGREDGNTVTQQNTLINAGDELTITSDRDTIFQGAQAKGDGITVDVGRDLRIESLQDSDSYHSTQTNTGLNIGGSVGPLGLTGLSGGINGDRTKMDSNYASVNEQSGLFGGNKGVEIDVEGNSHIKAGIIASEGKNNSFSTGTLTFEDIQNNAEFDVSSSGMSLSGNLNFGQSAQDEGKGGFSTPGASQSHHSGNAENRTQATIGNNVDITINDEANQTHDIATLNRDTDNAHQSLDKIFDKDKEQERLDEQTLISDIGNQLSNIVRTEGQIRAEKAKNDKTAIAEAERELLAEGKNPTEQEIKQRAENNAMRDWGTGGKYQQITQAVTGALQGVFNGDLTQALANGSAPFLAEAIKNATTNPDGSVNTEANLAAHAILGALLSQANGNSALAGGLGTLSAKVAAQLVKEQLYGDKAFEDLTESERQNISALAQIAAAVAGGLAGDSSSDAAQGAIAGKNAVENNNLGNDINIFNLNPNYIDGAGSLILHLQSQGATPEEIALAIENYGKAVGKPREEVLLELANFYLDLIPVIGDAKGFYEAESAIDYLIASVALIPGAGDVAGKLLKEAKVLAKNGDYEGANKLIDEARTATNAHNSARLNTQLRAQEIANGHAFDKHVLERKEFNSLGIKTHEEFQDLIEQIINNSTDIRYHSDGRTVYIDSKTRTIVISNPNKGEGTAFRPDYGDGWDEYINGLPSRNKPY